MYRTFIKLDDVDLDFVHAMQKALKSQTGKHHPVHLVIKSIIRDYRNITERQASPDILASYRSFVPGGRRLKRKKTAF